MTSGSDRPETTGWRAFVLAINALAWVVAAYTLVQMNEWFRAMAAVKEVCC